MSDMMEFPQTVEEFMEQYKVVDTDHIYSNGTVFVPIFRMKQWFDHVESENDHVEVVRCKDCGYWDRETVRQNSNDFKWWNEAVCKQHSIDGNEPHEMWTDADWYCADGERKYE